MDDKKIDLVMDDFNKILVNSQQQNFKDSAYCEDYPTQNEVENKFVEIKIDEQIYKKLLLKSDEMKKNPIDVLNEIIEIGLKNNDR